MPSDSSITVVLMGVSGSGKSTVMQRMVERLGWPFAEGDDFHSDANVAKMAAGRPLTDDDRWPWLRAIATWIGERERVAENAVVTCSALKKRYRDLLVNGHPSVRFAHLVVDRDLLASRMAQRRGHYMPPVLLDSQLNTLEPLRDDEAGFAICGDLPPDRIVDEVVSALQL